jgi:hypothetical protein
MPLITSQQTTDICTTVSDYTYRETFWQGISDSRHAPLSGGMLRRGYRVGLRPAIFSGEPIPFIEANLVEGYRDGSEENQD